MQSAHTLFYGLRMVQGGPLGQRLYFVVSDWEVTATARIRQTLELPTLSQQNVVDNLGHPVYSLVKNIYPRMNCR